jgi:hypothetical protein
MRFFTPDKYVALQNTDPAAMDAADAAWEEAVAQYDAYLQSIRPQLPPHVLELLDGYSCHDADVLSIGRQGDGFVIALQLDAPPHDLLTITYTLTEEPQLDPTALPPEYRQSRPLWLHEELEVVGTDANTWFRQALLLSNGWEVRLTFRDVRLATARPVFPWRGVAVAGGEAISQPA